MVDVLHDLGEFAVCELLDSLDDADYGLRAVISDILLVVGEAAVPAMLDALHEWRKDEVRELIVNLVSDISDDYVVQNCLVDLLQDSNWFVARAAANSLLKSRSLSGLAAAEGWYSQQIKKRGAPRPTAQQSG